jgi:hypothetical protein
MTPKEKAEILVGQYIDIQTKIEWTENVETLKKCEALNSEIYEDVDKYWRNLAKQCALIAVDEILEMDLPIFEEDCDEFYDYWEQVKQEINNL